MPDPRNPLSGIFEPIVSLFAGPRVFGPQRCLLVLDGSRVMRFGAQTGRFMDEFVEFDNSEPRSVLAGPDGLLYTCSETAWLWNSPWFGPGMVNRFSLSKGHFVDTFIPWSGYDSDIDKDSLAGPVAAAFGPDKRLYVSSHTNLTFGSRPIRRFDPKTGSFIDIFVPAGSGGMEAPIQLTFGADNNLYVLSGGMIGLQKYGKSILRFDGSSGVFIDEFISSEHIATAMEFGPDGHLYVTEYPPGRVARYNGTSGIFIDEFVSNAGGELDRPTALRFGPNGDLYVAALTIKGEGPTPPPNSKPGVYRYSGTTGELLDSFGHIGRGRLFIPSDLAFSYAKAVPPDVDLPWQRVPRWLQVILLVTLGAFLVNALGRRLDRQDR